MNIQIPIKEIDFPLLKKQKGLLAVLRDAPRPPTDEERDAINGILNLIDDIQDYAVDHCGLDEDEVFSYRLKD